MLKKTAATVALGAGSLLAVAVPASADPEPTSSSVEQVGLVNINNFANNACVLPWGQGQVLAVNIPLANWQDFEPCGDGLNIQE